MRITFLSNIPSPYKVDFFNQLGKNVDLKVIFEAERNYDLNKKWYNDKFDNFECIFLKSGAIEEKKFNWKVLKHLNRENQEIIIVTNYSYLTELIALIYIKLKRIPYCMEVDGGIIKEENSLLRYFKKFLIKGAKAYISPSEATDKFLINYGVKKDRIYRYPFTSLRQEDLLNKNLNSNEKITIRESIGIKEEKVILSVGQFIPRKGFDILLNASKELPENIGIYIVGGEPTEEYIRIKNELNLKNVHFVGFKSKEELKEYYKAADLFVFPTREDIWGLVINEAMAYGLPIITTDKCIAGLELIEENKNGFIVEVDSATQLREKIEIILNDKNLMFNMSRNNINKIINYSIEKMAEKHIDIFNKIVEGGE